MSQAAVLTHGQGSGDARPTFRSPASSVPAGSTLLPEAEEWHLYRTWPRLVLGPSFTVSQPLSSIPLLPARDPTGKAFRLRLCVLAPVLKLAQRELLAAGSGKGRGARSGPTEEELALTILLTAYILVEPYLSEGVEASLQPFRPLVEECVSALSSSRSSSAAKSRNQDSPVDVRRNLIQALRELLSDASALSSRSPSEILQLQEAHNFPLHELAGQDTGVGSPPPPALRPDEALTLLSLASERALSLSESRKLSNCLKSLTLNEISAEQLGPDKFAAIAVHTPRIAVELVEAMVTSSEKSSSSWEHEVYFQAAGLRLPVNESKSFDFVLKLLGLNMMGGETSVPFLVYRHLLPAYLSRCFSSISQTEETRRNENQSEAALEQEIDDDDLEGGVHYRRSSLSESTTRDLESLLGFLHRTFLLDLLPLLESTAAAAAQQQEAEHGSFEFIHLRRIADALSHRAPNRAAAPTLEQCQELCETLEAVAVEMKAFALEMVRYRSGGELLRRLM